MGKRREAMTPITPSELYAAMRTKPITPIAIECGMIEDPWVSPPADAYR